MTPPTLPPEAVKAGMDVLYPAWHRRVLDRCKWIAKVEAALLAAYPALRRSILEAELPRIVEMTRSIGGSDGWTWHLGEPKEGWTHDPASILDQLTREG